MVCTSIYIDFSMLDTRSLSYCAILGPNHSFTAGNDFFIECDIDLKLPSSISDLLPPDTVLKSQPLKYSKDLAWSTTLTYYLSSKLFKYLVKQNAKLRLKIYYASRPKSPCHVFDIFLSDARYLQQVGSTTNIQDHILHELQHSSVTGKYNLELQCGLFVVNMPKEVVNMPKEKQQQQQPYGYANNTYNRVSSKNASNCVTQRKTTPITSCTSDSEDSLMSHLTADFSVISKSSAASSVPPSYQQIGNGQEQYTLYFNLISTNFVNNLSLASVTNENVVLLPQQHSKITFRYELFGETINTVFEHGKPMDYTATHFYFRGNSAEIYEWLHCQPKLRVSIFVRDGQSGQATEVGYSMVSLGNIFKRGFQANKGSFQALPTSRSVPIFDRKNRLVLQSKTSISSLNFQAGLFPDWVHNEAEISGPRSLVEHTESYDPECQIPSKVRWLDSHQSYACFDAYTPPHCDDKHTICNSVITTGIAMCSNAE